MIYPCTGKVQIAVSGSRYRSQLEAREMRKCKKENEKEKIERDSLTISPISNVYLGVLSIPVHNRGHNSCVQCDKNI